MLQLKDIFKAPLDAAYGSLKQMHAEADRDMVRKHFIVKEDNDPRTVKRYGGPLRTLCPLENAVQFKNKHGITQEMHGPTIAFDQLTCLHMKELVLDFDVSISEMRRRVDGELLVNAALQKPTVGDGGGGFHFSVVYKNELAPAVSKLQCIFSDVLDGQYTILKDNDDLRPGKRSVRRINISKTLNKLKTDVDFVVSEPGGHLVLSALVKICTDIDVVLKYLEDYPEEAGTQKRLDSIRRQVPSMEFLLESVRLSTNTDAIDDYGIRYRANSVVTDVYTTDRLYIKTAAETWNLPTDGTVDIDATALLVPV